MSDKIKTQLHKIERIKTLGIDAIIAAEIYGIDAQTMYREFIDKVNIIHNLRQWARAQALAYVKGYHDAYIRAHSHIIYWLDGKQVRRETIPSGTWSRVIAITCWQKSHGIVYLGNDPKEHREWAKLCLQYASQIQHWREICGPQPTEPKLNA